MSFRFPGYVSNIVFFHSRKGFVIIPKRLEISLFIYLFVYLFIYFFGVSLSLSHFSTLLYHWLGDSFRLRKDFFFFC